MVDKGWPGIDLVEVADFYLREDPVSHGYLFLIVGDHIAEQLCSDMQFHYVLLQFFRLSFIRVNHLEKL